MTPATMTLSSYVYGDTWNGITEIVVEIDAAPPAVALASVEMEFRRTNTPSVLAKMIESPTGITITSAANWEIAIPAQDLGLNAGVYDWYLTTTDEDGTAKTYLTGTIEVLRS